VNELSLSGWIAEARPLRYTPAGTPVLELKLSHQSDVTQAGRQRRIELHIAAMAFGDVALLLADSHLGEYLSVKGFLAPSRQGSSRLVLHIQEFNRQLADSAPITV